MNAWDVTVTTTKSNNLPVTETAELLLMVEVPGYNDWWQKQNGNATLSIPAIQSGPAGDDDGDGLTNFFEFMTGSDPLLHTSDPRNPNPIDNNGVQAPVVPSFKLILEPVAGNPSQLQITYGPLIKGQTYTVRSSDSLSSGTWTSVDTFTPNAAMVTRVVTVSTPSTPARFYTVEIQKP